MISMISWISISITYDYWPSTGPLKDFTYTWVGVPYIIGAVI